MKQIIVLLLSILMSVPAFGQVIDASELNKLESGQFKLEPGKVQITFADTVTDGYMQKKISELGYEVLNSNFQNILLTVTNNPKPEELKKIEDHESVEYVINETSDLNADIIKKVFKNYFLDDSKIEQMLSQKNQNSRLQITFIALHGKATVADAEQIITNNPELDIHIMRKNHRTAIIKTDLEREAEAMDALSQLKIVKSTALLGVIE